MPEHFLLHDLLGELDADEMIDFVMPKPNPEFLVSGYAYTAHQSDKTKCAVRAVVGDISKQGLVFGDRFLVDNKITNPAEFDRISMSWSNSFGGPEHFINPLGTGAQGSISDGLSGIRLPNLEGLTDRYTNRQSDPEPFNFGMHRFDWPRRMSKMGTVSQTWIEEVGSGFFDDLDFTAFNAASEDQIWHDKSQLSMNEKFEMWNMHPEEQCWQGTLPGLRARCFIERREAPGELKEVDMRPTTAWFVPHFKNVILLYHGNIEITEDDGYDVTAIMGAIEKMESSPRDFAHYVNTFNVRAHSERRAYHALKDDELMPADLLDPWIEKEGVGSNEIFAKLAKMPYGRRQFPEGFIGPIKPITLGDAAEQFDRMQQESEQIQREFEQERKRALLELNEDKNDGRSADQKEQLRNMYTGSAIESGSKRDKIQLPHSGPPDYSALNNNLEVLQLRQNYRKLQSRNPDGAKKLIDTARYAKRALDQMYLYSVQYQKGAARISPQKSVEIRRKVKQHYDKDRNLSGMDLTGADLSGMDLKDADFSNAKMESVDLTRCDLSGCIFDETVLARSTLVDTILERARLDNTNLSSAIIKNCSFNHASLNGVIVDNPMAIENCTFHFAFVLRIQADRIKFVECSWRNAEIKHNTMTDSVLEQCDIFESIIEKTDFFNCELDTVNLDNCELISTTFLKSRLIRLHLKNMRCSKLNFTPDNEISSTYIESSFFQQCIFREIPFTNVTFERTILEQCDFSLANMHGCVLHKCSTPQAMFMRTNFDQANLSGTNFMSGNLQKSSFIGANLSSCNFFRADMSETILDASTRTENAYIKNTRLVPKSDYIADAGLKPE